jgi:hypothetical protein
MGEGGLGQSDETRGWPSKPFGRVGHLLRVTDGVPAVGTSQARADTMVNM